MKEKVIAIDLGASNIRIALVDQDGSLSNKKKVPFPGDCQESTVLTNLIISLIKDYLKENGELIKAISLVVAGPIDKDKGLLINPPNIPFQTVSIVEPIKKELKLPVFFSNDCNAAVWGEKIFGLGQGYQNIVYLTISSGIGGGILADNHLLLGEDNNAGEIGHFIIENEYNLSCGCGGKGHWESYTAGKHIVNFFRLWLDKNKIKKAFQVEKPADIFSLARSGNVIALRFIEQIGQINAKGVSNIIVAYNPALIVLGGALALNNQDFIVPYLKEHIDQFLRTPEIKVSQLADDVTLIGAAALVFSPPQ